MQFTRPTRVTPPEVHTSGCISCSEVATVQLRLLRLLSLLSLLPCCRRFCPCCNYHSCLLFAAVVSLTATSALAPIVDLYCRFPLQLPQQLPPLLSLPHLPHLMRFYYCYCLSCSRWRPCCRWPLPHLPPADLIAGALAALAGAAPLPAALSRVPCALPLAAVPDADQTQTLVQRIEAAAFSSFGSIHLMQDWLQ